MKPLLNYLVTYCTGLMLNKSMTAQKIYRLKMDIFIPSLSSIPTTMVRVVPSGTIPVTGLAQGPLPCWISIQQSTLSPEIERNREIAKVFAILFCFGENRPNMRGSKVINQFLVFLLACHFCFFFMKKKRFMNFSLDLPSVLLVLCGQTFRWIVDLIFCVSWTSFDLLMFRLIYQV